MPDDDAELLRGRIRIGLWLILAANAVFAVADWRFGHAALFKLYAIKLVTVAAVAWGLFELRRARAPRRTQWIGLGAVAVACVATAVSGVVTDDLVSTPILCATVVLGSATLLPWRLGLHVAATAIAAGAVLLNAALVAGDLPHGVGYPVVAVLVAIGFSIAIAGELARSRRRLAEGVRLRQEAEHALWESEERYRDLVENANDAIFTHDLNGRITSFNRAAENLTGYSREEALQRTIWQLLLPEDAAAVRARLDEAAHAAPASTPPVPVERRIRTRDGRTRVLEVSSRMLFHDDRPVAVDGVARDVTERRQAEELLRENEARLRELASHIPGIMYQFLLKPDGTFSFPLVIDSPYLTTFGFTAEEVQRNPQGAFSFIEPEDVGRLWEAIAESARTLEPQPAEFRARTTSGELKWLRASSTLERLPDGSVLSTGLIIDISDRKRAEEVRSQLAAIVESSEDAIVGRTLDGTIVSWNAGAEQVFGYTAAEAVGRPVDMLVPPDRPDEMPHLLAQILGGERIRHFETVRVRKNGERFHVSLSISPIKDANGQIVGVSTIARDITDRMQAEAALRTAHAELERRVEERTGELVQANVLLRQEIEERERAEQALIAARESAEQSSVQFLAVLDTVGEAIVTIDANGAIVMLNHEAEKLWGYPREELLGRNLQILMPVEFRPQHVAGLRRYLESGTPRIIGRRVELEGLKKDGTRFPLEVSVAETRIGQRVLFTGAVRDISERRQAETELKKAKDAAEAATRAKSKFLAGMSHEIRTPMNAVIGMTGLLLDTDLTPEQREYAETVRRSGEVMLTLINSILDFSKVESDRIELENQPFDLRACVEDALDLVASPAAAKGLELAYGIDEGVPDTVVGDVGRVRQILVNLLDNAVRFTHTGEVVLSVKAHRLAEQRYQVHFAVRDTGIGIPPDRRERLFQPFTQIDAAVARQYGGTGLGLVISKRLAELMGGVMWVESEPGKGSTFFCTIQADATPAPSRVYPRGVRPALRGKRALVIEDNDTTRRLLRQQLEAWGMQVVTCAGGGDALAAVRGDGAFDVALVDMHMPERDGVAVAAELRGEPAAQALPIVMLTAVGRRGAIAAASEAAATGLAAYIMKPIKPYQLHEVLAGLFAAEPAPGRRGAARPRIDGTLAERRPLRILLAEDTEVSAKVALRLLERMGYRADLAANGLEVLQALSRQPYDVILMDVRMPEMDGLEATRQIHARWPPAQRPRIIALTAYALQDDREECLAAGMDDYLSKPIQVDELQAAIERCRPLDADGRGPIAPLADVLDRNAFARLRAGQEAGEADLVTELIDIFLRNAPELLDRARAAAQAGDARALHEAAHRLKSSSAQLGAVAMAALAQAIEQQGRAGSIDDAEAQTAALAREYERVRPLLEAERRPNGLEQ